MYEITRIVQCAQMSRRGQKRAVHPAPLEKYKKMFCLTAEIASLKKEITIKKLLFTIQSNYLNKFISQVLSPFLTEQCLTTSDLKQSPLASVLGE